MTADLRRAGRLVAGLLLGCVVSLSGCAVPWSGSTASSETPLQLRGEQLIVAVPLLTPALRSDLARRLARQYDLTLVGAFPLTSVDVHCIVVEVPPGRDVDRLTRELESFPGVGLVQRNQRFETMAAAHTDPYASFQHGAETLGAPEVHRWSTGKGVRVAVVDTGVDTDHPDLAERVVEARNFVEGGEESFLRDAHGTAVAGIIAARADNGEGIYGIAPDVDLVVAKACWQVGAPADRSICSSWTLARAIDFAIRSGVRVLNLSLAGPDDPLMRRLLAAAEDARVVVAAAAGDDARGPAFPASIDSVLAVVASEVGGAVPEMGWAADEDALAAPGEEIITTAPGARYRFLSGSSLSTAHVTGAVALLLQRDPELSPAAVGALLEATGRSEAGPDGGSRIRRVDACAAIHRLSGGDACP